MGKGAMSWAPDPMSETPNWLSVSMSQIATMRHGENAGLHVIRRAHPRTKCRQGDATAV